MVLQYQEALAVLDAVANDQRRCRQAVPQHIPLQEAVGRILASDIVSAESTPAHDTSAMDGYAIRSDATRDASPSTPARFRVRGRIAAGDDPRPTLPLTMSGKESCLEIMTGAIFPDELDACVKFEDTDTVVDNGLDSEIVVTKPITRNANKRLAGNDIQKGTVILKAGTTLQVNQVLPLSSLGVGSVTVVAKPRVAVFSTGKELLPTAYAIPRDMNGPYLATALAQMGADVDFRGVLDDEPALLYHHLQTVADSGTYEVIVTSGAVSKGRCDHIPAVLSQMNAEILFHGVAMRPGHPVLFALLPPGSPGGSIAKQKKTAFFGLPGNPGAAAACFRFLVVPYLRALTGLSQEDAVIAGLATSQMSKQTVPCSGEGAGATATARVASSDVFAHGVLRATAEGGLIVRPSKEQSPAKLGPFATANCWIHFRTQGQEKLEAGLVECYPISATATGFPLATVSSTLAEEYV